MDQERKTKLSVYNRELQEGFNKIITCGVFSWYSPKSVTNKSWFPFDSKPEFMYRVENNLLFFRMHFWIPLWKPWVLTYKFQLNLIKKADSYTSRLGMSHWRDSRDDVSELAWYSLKIMLWWGRLGISVWTATPTAQTATHGQKDTWMKKIAGSRRPSGH